MKRSRISSLLGVLVLLAASFAAVKAGDPAPDFTATDSNGASHKLSAYRGKYVVLEWHNQGCPYTRKHYESGNMQQLQKQWTARGVVWLTIISSAPGKQGYVNAADENSYLKQMNAAPTAALLDPTGTVGHLYSAKTTPHMFIIDPGGNIVYNGAIDSKPTADAGDIPSSVNYVNLALEQALSGKAVSTASTQPYGCSVKYPD